MYKSLSVLLIAFAFSTPAHADVFGFLSSNGGPAPVAEGHVYAPAQTSVVGGGVVPGYPFYSGCCESQPACSTGWWDGFCGRGCGACCRPWGHAHQKGICGKGGCGKGGCGSSGFSKGGYATGGYGKGGCGACGTSACGCGGKSGWGHLSYRGLGCGKGGCGKGGCGYGSPCGTKGYASVAPCGPKHHCKLGLFDWMHFGHHGGKGKGCDACGDVGCSSCGGGVTSYGKGDYLQPAPIQGYDHQYYGTPKEAEGNSTIQPPEVIVAPTSISDRSAWRSMAPANPFARPFGY